MKVIAAVIGMGIGQKHLDAIDNYKKSFVKIICEKNDNKIKFLKKKYPDKIIIVKFEDLINDTKNTSKKLCKQLNIRYEKNMLNTSVLGNKSIGNSSFKKNKSVQGKVYKNSINRKLNIDMPLEYKEIYKMIEKVSL